MDRLDEITAKARARGLRPWIAVKEGLAERAVLALADEPRAVLQGGAALHFVYGSPRLSADVDFVGDQVALALAERGEGIARAAAEWLDRPARWSLGRTGRLLRGKVTVEIDPARRLVLPVEAYEVPARRPRLDPRAGAVEEPEEITADKVVASADRLARRGTLKTRDLFDLWFLTARLGARAPEAELVAQKLKDYRQPARGADLAAAARAIPEEEIQASLEGVLPEAELAGLRVREVVEAAVELMEKYRDVL